MPDLNNIIDNTSTIPANSEPEAPSEDTSGVPEEVLQLPIMAALLSGAPPAIYTKIGTKTPEIATVLANGSALNKIGIGFYRSDKSKLDVAYNTRFISPELIRAADTKDKLKEVASNYAEVSASVNGVAPTMEGSPATASAGGMPSPVPVDSPLDTQRKNNLTVQSPTSGLAGQGRVLNSLIQPTV